MSMAGRSIGCGNGYEIKITYQQGIGTFNSPLTTTPYGFVIFGNKGNEVYRRDRYSSNEESAIEGAVNVIERGL